MTEEETHQVLQNLDKRVSEKMQSQAAEKSAAS